MTRLAHITIIALVAALSSCVDEQENIGDQSDKQDSEEPLLLGTFRASLEYGTSFVPGQLMRLTLNEDKTYHAVVSEGKNAEPSEVDGTFKLTQSFWSSTTYLALNGFDEFEYSVRPTDFGRHALRLTKEDWAGEYDWLVEVVWCGGSHGDTCLGATDSDYELCDVRGCGESVGECVWARAPNFCAINTANPGCGCDGETYETTCERLHAGVALDYSGTCDP